MWGDNQNNKKDEAFFADRKAAYRILEESIVNRIQCALNDGNYAGVESLANALLTIQQILH